MEVACLYFLVKSNEYFLYIESHISQGHNIFSLLRCWMNLLTVVITKSSDLGHWVIKNKD